MTRFPRALIAGITLFSASVGIAAAEEIDLFPEGTFDADPRTPASKDDASDAEEQALRSATYCDRYGPDYVLVESTTTCIKATGYIQLDVYTRSR